jgi:hypothetical protein
MIDQGGHFLLYRSMEEVAGSICTLTSIHGKVAKRKITGYIYILLISNRFITKAKRIQLINFKFHEHRPSQRNFKFLGDKDLYHQETGK